MIAREIQMLDAIIQFDAYLDLLQYFIFLVILYLICNRLRQFDDYHLFTWDAYWSYVLTVSFVAMFITSA